MTDARPPSGRRIIDEIVREMLANVYPLHDVTLAPRVYHIYLHPADFEVIEGVLPQITSQVQRALDEAVRKENRRRTDLTLMTLVSKREPPIQVPSSGWEIQIKPDADNEVHRGQFGVISRLSMPVAATFAGGKLTERIVKTVIGDASRTTTSRTETLVRPGEPPAAAEAAGSAGATPAPRGARRLARISFADEQGDHVYVMEKDRILIGRGGPEHWVDLQVAGSTRISREHARIWRHTDGRFYIKDLSVWGTAVDGQTVPPGVEETDGIKREKDGARELPPRATITLGGTLELKFEAD